jgi:hypothetical protein
MTIEQALTDEERLAELSLEQLSQLVGLVQYDASSDPFPIAGWDALVWVVGNATQAALFCQIVYGMELVAYAGPETGQERCGPVRAHRRDRPRESAGGHPRQARRRHRGHRPPGR